MNTSASTASVCSAKSSHIATPSGSKSLRCPLNPVVGHVNGSASQGSNQSATVEKPQDQSELQQQQSMMMTTMNRMMVGSESDGGGTLVGQWSTLDSQVVANHCVSCLPVAVCLRGRQGGGGSNSEKAKPCPVSVYLLGVNCILLMW